MSVFFGTTQFISLFILYRYYMGQWKPVGLEKWKDRERNQESSTEREETVEKTHS